MTSAGSSPELALESFTVSSDPCSFGLTVSCLRSVTFGLSDRRSFDARHYTRWRRYGQYRKLLTQVASQGVPDEDAIFFMVFMAIFLTYLGKVGKKIAMKTMKTMKNRTSDGIS